MCAHPPPPRYRAASIRRFPAGGNSDLVYFTDEKSAHLLPSEVVNILDSCRSFRTLENHLKEICGGEGRGADQVAVIKKLLSDLAAAGMLISDRDILSRCTTAARAEAPPPISSIGFVTRERTDKLARAVVSYAENGKEFGRAMTLVVADDSGEAATRARHRRLLRAIKNRYGVEIYYAGAEEKLRYAETLAAQGLPPDVINFALFDEEGCGYSPGANRNALLLHTVGDLFFSADDDTMCRVAAPPEGGDNLSFLGESEPREFWFFPDRHELMRSANILHEDFLSAHEQLLGRGLGDVVRDFSQDREVEIEDLCPHLIQSMGAGRGEVRATFNGLFGDAGMPTPVGLLWNLDGNTHERLVRSEAGYRTACGSREMLSAVRNTTICHSPQCMSAFLGLDNRSLLPPFMPVQRNEDGVFGLVLYSCFADAYSAHIPRALLHAPESRAYPPDYTSYLTGNHFDATMMLCVGGHRHQFGGQSDRENLQSLGRHLIELGSIHLHEFEEFVRLQLWRQFSHFVAYASEVLKTYDFSPRYWAEDLEKCVDARRKAILKKDHIVPRDLLGGRAPDEARALAQRLVLRFGQLLWWWPDIVEVATRLRARGERPARSV